MIIDILTIIFIIAVFFKFGRDRLKKKSLCTKCAKCDYLENKKY